jgi:hypothetical protein
MNIPKNLRIASETSMEDRAIVLEERQVGDATQVALLAVKRDIYRAIADRIVTDAERERVLAGLAILASGVRRMQELDEANDRNSLRLCRAVDGLRTERAACEAAQSAA